MPKPEVRVAVLGLGRIASLLEDDALREKPATHAGAFQAQPGTVLAGGWDPVDERRTAFTARWGAPTGFQDPEDLLVRVRPDLVVVATPPDSHRPLVALAARLGVGVIVCEKPLAPTVREARALVAAAARAGSRLVVNHERRYARDYQRVRRLVSEGTHGALLSITARLYLGRSRSPAQVLYWDGTHLIDILRYLTGHEVGRVSAWGRPATPGGSLGARWTMGPTSVVIEVAGNRDHFVFELDLSFERGRVRIGNGLYDEGAGGPSPLYEHLRSLLPVPVDPADLSPSGYFSGMAADAVGAVGDPGRVPLSSGADGLAALEGVDRILRAAGSGLGRRSS